jgi:hypothetical protein
MMKKSEKFKMINKAYSKIGMSSFIKGCIDFLKNLYNVEKLDEKIDSNKNLLAFENLLYDLEIGNFRKIRHKIILLKILNIVFKLNLILQLEKELINYYIQYLKMKGYNLLENFNSFKYFW